MALAVVRYCAEIWVLDVHNFDALVDEMSDQSGVVVHDEFDAADDPDAVQIGGFDDGRMD